MSDLNLQHLLLEVDEAGIATITVNRPDKMNALNGDVLNELDELFTDLQTRKEVKGILITGAGDKAFVAGADIKELTDLNSFRGTVVSEYGQQVFRTIEQTSKPVIAVINGYALGGGLELAMACHLRVADKNARFGLPEVGLGLIPGYGGTQRLAHIIGKARALELILTGNFIKADVALTFGLINRLSAEGDSMNEAQNVMEQILQNGPLAIQKAIESVNAAMGRQEAGYRFEAEAFGSLCDTDDFREGTQAFLEKRKANFKGY